MIKYQEKLKRQIDSLDGLPHSLILVGDIGASFGEVCEYISSKFGLVRYDITDKVSDEYVNEILSSQTKSLYCVNIWDITTREQNILLKLFEEPTQYSYIILCSTNQDYILDTIKNRGYILKFERYSREQLREYIQGGLDTSNEKLILDICTTPGLVEISNHTNMKALHDLCIKMVHNMGNANFQNTLSISNKINYSDLYDKYDLNLFILMLQYVILHSNIDNKDKLFLITKNNLKYIQSSNNKQLIIEHMLIEMWRHFKN